MEFKSFNQRWYNRKVKKHKGTISEIQQQIPNLMEALLKQVEVLS